LSFCTSSSYHLDLHSFPTRRSSDLRASEEKLDELREIGADISGISDIYNIVCPSCNINYEYQEIKELDWHRERKLIQEFRIGFRDRKSTRLNSSHVKISYAVFCLKK